MLVDELHCVYPNPEAIKVRDNLTDVYQGKYGIYSISLHHAPIKAFNRDCMRYYVTGVVVLHSENLDFMVKAAIKHDAKPFNVFFELFVMPQFTMPGGRSNYYQSLGRANRWENKTTYTLFILKIQIAWLRFKNFFNSKLK